jgi:hypothetical protein
VVRSSSLTAATWSRFLAAEEAHAVAAVGRTASAERRVERAAHANAWQEQGEKRLDSARRRRERVGTLRVEMQSNRQRDALSTRAARDAREDEREDARRVASARDETRMRHEALRLAQRRTSQREHAEAAARVRVSRVLKSTLAHALAAVRGQQLARRQSMAAKAVRRRHSNLATHPNRHTHRHGTLPCGRAWCLRAQHLAQRMALLAKACARRP